MEQISDCELIAQIRAGDERAFAVLMHRHSRRVYAHVGRLVRLAEDVDDLVQLVFIKVFRHLDGLRNVDQFEAWLHRLVRNTVYSWYRRQAVQLRLEDMPHIHNSETDAENDGLHLMIRSALRSLSQEHREVIAHHYLKGYSYAETATLLQVTVDTVRGRLKRARVRLKEELEIMGEIDNVQIELDRTDLVALNKAKRFVSDDEKRLVLQGICLDVGGRIVATNGHALLVRVSERLKAIAGPIILGPWTDVDLAEGDRATLIIGETEAVIEVAGQKKVRVPLIAGPFVQYEQVMPQEVPLMQVTVDSQVLLHALDLVQDHLEARHPESEDWHYKPNVELQVSALAQTVTFLTSRDMGYNRPVGEGKVQSFMEADENISPGGPVDWSFQVPITGQFEDVQKDTLRVGVNFRYFQNMVDALDIGSSEEMTLIFRDQNRPILFLSPEQKTWCGLVMPLRLADLDKV